MQKSPQDGQDSADFSRADVHEFFEFPDGVRDGFTEFCQRRDDRRTLEELDIAKEYINGRIGFLIELEAEVGAKVHEFGAAVWPYGKSAVFESQHQLCALKDFRMSDGGGGDDWSENLVLVSVVEQIQSEKFLARPAWVSFKGEKEFDRVCAGRFYSTARGLVVPLDAARRESQSPVLLTAVDPNEFPRGVIQSGSQVVNGIANEQSEGGWNGLIEADLDDHRIRLRIFAEAKTVAVACEVIPSGTKILDVLIGPF